MGAKLGKFLIDFGQILTEVRFLNQVFYLHKDLEDEYFKLLKEYQDDKNYGNINAIYELLEKNKQYIADEFSYFLNGQKNSLWAVFNKIEKSYPIQDSEENQEEVKNWYNAWKKGI